MKLTKLTSYLNRGRALDRWLRGGIFVHVFSNSDGELERHAVFVEGGDPDRITGMYLDSTGVLVNIQLTDRTLFIPSYTFDYIQIKNTTYTLKHKGTVNFCRGIPLKQLCMEELKLANDGEGWFVYNKHKSIGYTEVASILNAINYRLSGGRFMFDGDIKKPMIRLSTDMCVKRVHDESIVGIILWRDMAVGSLTNTNGLSFNLLPQYTFLNKELQSCLPVNRANLLRSA